MSVSWALAALLALTAQSAAARSPVVAEQSVRATEPAALTLSQLPPEGRLAYRLIRQGGPFLHEKDGSVFGNRERLLPSRKRGFYREYTVMTPAARDRGARRIVCGGPALNPVVCYYTADHYTSFQRLEGSRD